MMPLSKLAHFKHYGPFLAIHIEAICSAQSNFPTLNTITMT